MKYFFDEVNAVDKYEYKLKTDQMLELMEDGAYSKAAAIADEIDWKRVRNAVMLTNVSDIYEKNGEYRKSYDVLTIAYHRAEGSRKIISRLCSLAIQTGNVDEAIDYYDDFMQIAPKDPNQYILKYQILRAQRAPVEQQIEALEEYKKSEYIEEWAYELARLYQEAGMTAECLEECDDLILWFSEGQYVYKAMELKMQFKPLTPSQQEKYDHRYEKLSAETEEMPDMAAYVEEKESVQSETEQDNSVMTEHQEESAAVGKDQTSETDEAAGRESAEEIKKSSEEEGVKTEIPGKRKKLGDTMPLGEALRRLLHPETSESDKDKDSESDNGQEEPKLDDLEQAIGEIESVADIDMAERAAEKRRKPISLAGGMKEIIPDIIEETEEVEQEVFESVSSDIADEDQIEGQLSLEDIISDWEGEAEPETDEASEEAEDLLEGFDVLPVIEENAAEEFEELEVEDIEEAEELEELETEDIEEAEEFEELEAEDVEEAEEFEELEVEDIEEAEEFEELEAEDVEETEEFEELEVEDAEDAGTFEGENLDETENLSQNPENDDELKSSVEKGEKEGENMDRIKKTEPILPPDIQRMIDEIEGVIPPEEERRESPVRERRQIDEPRENMGKIADELRIDEDDEFEEDLFDDDYAIEEAEEYFDEEELPEENEYEEADEEYPEEADDYSDEILEQDTDGYEEDEFPDESDSEDFFEEDSEDDDQKPDFEEEFRVNPDHASGLDDREIPDEDDGIDIMSATTPLSRKETAKLIATGKTAPLPLDEISDALSMSDTGFIVHGRYDLELQSGIGTRAGLTEEQKKLFSYFVPVRGMSEQLVDVLEQDKNCTNRGGTSRTGNLLIIGNKGNGKTVLAVDVVKAIQRQRNIRQGKVAIVTGDSLNKKKISDIFDKLYGGALIIEKAGKMNEKTVARLNKAMERDSGELLIVLEEQRKPLDRLLSSNRDFRRKFTSRLEVPIFINDELVTFGQTYAQENGYKIDEMGILALYSKIDSLQREDHAVTVAEVKEIMDDAIRHSQKASAKKLVKRVFGRNTDDADRILLSEKDFNI